MLPVGKLDSELLREIVFEKITLKRDEVKVRAAVGEDCAVIDFGEYDCIISTDPITAAVEEIGRLAIHISCNDIASNGVEPVGIMLTVMLPKGTVREDVEKIMSQAGQVAGELNVEIVGGHTEITTAVSQPVIVSTAFGRKLNKGKETPKIMADDVIIMTKSAGIEGMGIIASDLKERLEFLNDNEISRAKAFLEEVSVVKEGVAAGKVGVCQMHDITEGGVLGAVWEMCQVGQLGAHIEEAKISIHDITRKTCDHFKIDPLRLISSGCMLIIARPEKELSIHHALEAIGVSSVTIGKMMEAKDGILLDGAKIAPPAGDEIYKVL